MKRILQIALLLLISITVLTAQNTGKKLLTVGEIFGGKSFGDKSLSLVKWIEGGNKFSHVKFDTSSNSPALFIYDVKKKAESILITGKELKAEDGSELSIYNYEWSADEKLILFTGIQHARAIKSAGAFHIYDIEKKKIIRTIESEQEQVNARLSPDSKILGFVRGNNLWYADIEIGVEKQLTFDGSETILNGVFDWVYEEEFSIIHAWEWSPDSRTIAFWRLDQSAVPKIQIAKWDSLYLNYHEMYYPKPGAPVSDVKIGAADISSGKITFADLGKETNIYIPRINFTSDPQLLCIQRMNRLQNKIDYLFTNVSTGKTEIVLIEEEEHWIDAEDNSLFFLKDNRFIMTSERDGWVQLYLHDAKGKLLNQITKGDFEVSTLTSIDEKNETVYYTSNERGTVYSDLYKIKFDGSGKQRLTSEEGTHIIKMNMRGNYYLDSYSNRNRTSETSLFDVNGTMISKLLDSDMSGYLEYNNAKWEFVSFTTTDGVMLNGAILKPLDMDDGKKHPVLISCYGGPGSQSVVDKWSGGTGYLWDQLLVQKGYIIFAFDNRGTKGRGREFKHLMYKQLGKWEVNDMIEAAGYLSSLPYVDAARIGVWGWSYGGYTSALTIMKAASYFKCAIAVAPVTDWRYYDAIYTERFMQTPELNPVGYKESSVMTYADSLRGNFLLVHGTADDNVHLQNSIMLSRELISKNKLFSEMFYPEKNHSISGGKTRLHLYRTLTKFILENL